MSKLILSSILTFTTFFTTLAQTGGIEGYITEMDNISPIYGASVYLEQTNYGSETNGRGHYVIQNIPEGNYILVISSLGHLTIKTEVSIKKKENLSENFVMKETISNLSEVTITGGKNKLKKIPGSAHYISKKDLDKFNYTDINRVLQAVPGVNIQEEDGFGLFPSIGLRGTGVERNTKITVMEDGVLIAPAPYAAPAAYYFPTMGRMQGVEVVKGSSQIKYGPYTTGGAINLISTQIPNEFSGRISLSGGSFGGRNLHTTVGNSYKNFAYLLETFQSSSNGFKEIEGNNNTGFDTNSGFIKQDYLAKFKINTNPDAKFYQSLTFKVGQAIGDINETYLGLTQNDFDTNPIRRYAGSQVDNIQTLQKQFSLTHTIKLSKYFNITSTAYRTTFSRNWYKLDRVKDNTGTKIKIAAILDNPDIYTDAYNLITGSSSVFDDALFVKANNRSYYSKGIQTKLNFNFTTNAIIHNIDFGVRIHQDQIDRFQWFDEYAMDNRVMQLTKSGIHGTESNRVETANAIATYLQYQLKIGRFTAIPGIRHERINSARKDYGTEDPNRTGANLLRRENAVSVFIPGIGLDYRFDNYLSAFVGVHKGFAPPGSKTGLKSEKSTNYELGTRYSKKGISGQAVLFFNNYTNLLGTDLEAAGGSGTNEQFNGGAVQTKGLEFNLTYDLLSSINKSEFSLPLTLVYSYTDAVFQNDFDSSFSGWGEVKSGDQFPYLANNQFTLILALEHQKFSLNLSGKYLDEMRTIPGQGAIPLNEKTDSYFLFDTNINFNVSKNISFFINATNLADISYIVARRPAGLRPGLPRAFNIGLKASF